MRGGPSADNRAHEHRAPSTGRGVPVRESWRRHAAGSLSKIRPRVE